MYLSPKAYANHGYVLDSNYEIYMIKNYKPSNSCKYNRIEKRNLAARRSTKHTKDTHIKFETPNYPGRTK